MANQGGREVFISYSHDDTDWHDRLIKALGPLQAHVQGCVWSDQQIQPGAEWQKEIDDALNSARVAVLLVSQSFLSSEFIMKHELPCVLEAAKAGQVRLIWVLLDHCLWQATGLSRFQAANDLKFPLKAFAGLDLQAELKRIAFEVWREVSPQGGNMSGNGGARPTIPAKVRVGRLPITGNMLIGRESELSSLDTFWEEPDVSVASVIAIGGAGKSTLVNHWLGTMRHDDYRGAERIFAWSFNSANRGVFGASADDFINAALFWFGDSNPTSGSAWERGERLADLIRQYRTLLLLDGLETLQNPPGTDEGMIRERGVAALVRELQGENQGLCLITSRLPVADLNSPFGTIDLDRLSRDDGVKLLRRLGIQGGKEELKKAVDEVDGHPLTLTLLGSYLERRFNGSIRKRALIPSLISTGQSLDRHAHDVLASYEDWFAESDGRELQVLRILGMFDRPARGALVRQLRSEPVIQGLNDMLVDLTDAQWFDCVARLRRSKLINPPRINQRGHVDDQEALDGHAIVRGYFGEQLKQNFPDAWQVGHERLYRYLIDESGEDLPDTYEEMIHLFEALVHGCHAERHSEVLHHVYWKRICRTQYAFHDRPIHGFQTMLKHLYAFCNPSSTEPLPVLEKDQRAFVREEIGHYRFLLGDYDEAIEPMEKGMEARAAQKKWQQASKYARLLRELHLVRGEFEKALDYAEKSVKWAELSELWQDDVTQLSGKGQVLSYYGKYGEARRSFEKAERIHAARRDRNEMPEHLYAYDGYWYCVFLLDRWREDLAGRHKHPLELLTLNGGNGGTKQPSLDQAAAGKVREKLREIENRARNISHMGKQNKWVLEEALGTLALAQTLQYEVLLFDHGRLQEGVEVFDRAIAGLRHEGQMHHLVAGLLNRAVFHRVACQWDGAHHDLDEALGICQRCGIKLYEADYHLESTRLALARHDGKLSTNRDLLEKARGSISIARAMVDSGYRRRQREVSAVERQLGMKASKA